MPGSFSDAYIEASGTPITGNIFAVTTVTQSYQATVNDNIIESNGAITITLPSAVGLKGIVYIVKRIYANGNTVVNTTGGQTIDGQASVTLTSQYDALEVVSNGANWDVI